MKLRGHMLLLWNGCAGDVSLVRVARLLHARVLLILNEEERVQSHHKKRGYEITHIVARPPRNRRMLLLLKGHILR